MIKTVLYSLFSLLLYICGFNALGQQNKIDSLISCLKTVKADTNKLNALTILAKELQYLNLDSTILFVDQAILLATTIEKNSRNQTVIYKAKERKADAFGTAGVAYEANSDYKKSLENYFKALAIDKAINDKVGMAIRLSNIGNVYGARSDYAAALNYYNAALKIDREFKDRIGIAIDFGNIGNVYLSQGNYSKALNYMFKALKIAEEIKFEPSIANNLGNIAIVYQNQGNDKKALVYYLKALALAEKLGAKHEIARHLGNLGTVYYSKKEYENALQFYSRSYVLREAIGDVKGMSTDLGNMGIVYREQGDSAKEKGNKEYAFNYKYPLALDHYLRSLKIKKELGDKSGIAGVLTNLSALYIITGKTNEAETNLLRALELATEIKATDLIKHIESHLSDLYSGVGKYELAYEHYKKHIAARDSISNAANAKKQTQLEMQYAFDKKQAADSIKNVERANLENQKHQTEIKEQKIYTWGGVILFGIMLIVAIVSFRAFRNKQKVNLIIAEQKLMVELKQNEIVDSIHYAKRIQEALLPSQKYIERNLKQLQKK